MGKKASLNGVDFRIYVVPRWLQQYLARFNKPLSLVTSDEKLSTILSATDVDFFRAAGSLVRSTPSSDKKPVSQLSEKDIKRISIQRSVEPIAKSVNWFPLDGEGYIRESCYPRGNSSIIDMTDDAMQLLLDGPTCLGVNALSSDLDPRHLEFKVRLIDQGIVIVTIDYDENIDNTTWQYRAQFYSSIIQYMHTVMSFEQVACTNIMAAYIHAKRMCNERSLGALLARANTM